MSRKTRTEGCYCCPSVLFFLALWMGCTHPKDSSRDPISLVWTDHQPTALSIPLTLLPSEVGDDYAKQVQIRLAKTTPNPAILGEYRLGENNLIFQPLIPFTPGLSYEVLINQQTVRTIDIPKATASTEITGIYPTQDTLPANLLKIYLMFSRPMRGGNVLEYVTLLNDKGDTLPNTFLNLQPELWNADQTLLTLWLDPGRIKRDLQPNQRLGAPLVEGQHYRLRVSDRWPDRQGAFLKQPYEKNFVVTTRDMDSPAPEKWRLSVPRKNTTEPLKIALGETLDFVLLQHTTQLTDAGGRLVEGQIQLREEESHYLFFPAKPWAGSRYTLRIESRLEDVAGNNLNRLFDRDMTNHKTRPIDRKLFELTWQPD